ncbi:hypothetical protein SAMN05892883_3115 [Jatrophihabitans sp. GAS493]|nr:hypothetical protein SAMN05892883_3115 [Jatrophihabitans sp. GAS493]
MKSASGNSVAAAVPMLNKGKPVKRVKIVISCTPENAPFSVLYGGVPKFWGACSGATGQVAGEFVLPTGSREVSVKTAAPTQWGVTVFRAG